MKSCEHIHLIGVEGEHVFDSLSYLICGERNVLIDCGSFEGFASVAFRLACHGLSVNDLDAVVATHCHRSHVQAAALLSTPVWMHHSGVTPVATGDYDLTASFLYRKVFKPFRVSRELRHGEEVTLNGGVLCCLHTPGHSPDSMCFIYRPRHGRVVLFGGDTVWGGFSERMGSDLAVWRESLELLLQQDFELVLPGHSSESSHPAHCKHDLRRAVSRFGKDLKPMPGGLLSPW